MSAPPVLLRRGPSRVRLATASLAAGAVLGTGALTWQVRSAVAAGSTTTTDAGTTGSSSDSSSGSSSGSLLGSDPGTGSGGADASSGGS